MSNASIERLLTSFYHSPTAVRLHRLQRSAFQTPGFDPAASFVRPLEAAVTMADPLELIERIELLPWFASICPRLHFVAARVRENLGEIEEMQIAVAKMQACLRGLMKTGDGSRESPYQVTFVTDERDMIRVLRGRLRCQEMVEAGGQRFDVLTMHSGQEVWFNVTPLVERYSVNCLDLDVERHLLAD